MTGPEPRTPRDVPASANETALLMRLHRHRLALLDDRTGREPLARAEQITHTLAALALAEAIAERVRALRWCDAADALSVGATLAETAAALALEPEELAAGLRSWADGQESLHRHYGSGGLTPAEAEGVRALVATPGRPAGASS